MPERAVQAWGLTWALARPRVSAMVAASACFGALLHGGAAAFSVVSVAVGAFLLCSGCSAWNQVQEAGRDARMERTRLRPVASGRMPRHEALGWALTWCLAGLALFFAAGGMPLLVLGGLVIAVYNGLYTPLKPRTALALLVGAVVGAFPPVAGWLAAGGVWSDPAVWAIAGLFYLWQVPHFWLLAQRHGEDYARAGFAVPASTLPAPVRARLMALWLAAYFAGAGCVVAAFGPGRFAGLTAVATLFLGCLTMLLALRGREGTALVLVNGSLACAMAWLLLAGA